MKFYDIIPINVLKNNGNGAKSMFFSKAYNPSIALREGLSYFVFEISDPSFTLRIFHIPKKISKIMKFVTFLLFFLVSTYASNFPTKQEIANTGDLPRVTILISNISKEAEGYLGGGNGNKMPDELFKTSVVTDEFKQMIQSFGRDNRLDPFAFDFK
ncbi:unnamed protein product [Debaryomyces tyrocola]|jgi:hypothetical protein|nr:unnamed protein product [Debaryomyces tyrocola]